MAEIKNVVFDLGGVIIHLDRECSVKRFEAIGIHDADELIDPYEQKGLFLELENGKIDFPLFCRKLRKHAGKEITEADIVYAWMGFVVEVPQYKLDYIAALRKRNYRLYLLSNTNPVVMQWARTPAFSSAGRPITAYFDAIYASYEIGITKPDPKIFDYMLRDSCMKPSETLFVDDGKRNIEVGASIGLHTYLPLNAEDWREPVERLLQR